MHWPQIFSVLIPFHNSHETVQETISSIVIQNVGNIEIIIADDHSTEESRAILDEIVSKKNNIKVIDVEGRGPSAARNAAAKSAMGHIYCFLDADDCLKPGALKAFETFLRASPRVAVTFGRVRITDDPSTPGGITTPLCEFPSLAQIIGENRICTASNIVVRARAFKEIGGFDETLFHAEDQEWLSRAYLNKNWSLVGVDRVTLDYRTSKAGLSSDLRKMESGWCGMIGAIKRYSNAVSQQQISEATGLFYRYLARRALRLGKSRTDGFVFMIQSLGANPLLLSREMNRTWPTLLGSIAVLLFGAAPFQKTFR